MIKQCQHPFCSSASLTGSRFCASHKVERVPTNIPKKFVPYPYNWNSFSKTYRLKNPFCSVCGKPSQLTGHKIPNRILIEKLGLNYLEWIIKEGLVDAYFFPLCYSCNNKQTFQDGSR